MIYIWIYRMTSVNEKMTNVELPHTCLFVFGSLDIFLWFVFRCLHRSRVWGETLKHLSQMGFWCIFLLKTIYHVMLSIFSLMLLIMYVYICIIYITITKRNPTCARLRVSLCMMFNNIMSLSATHWYCLHVRFPHHLWDRGWWWWWGGVWMYFRCKSLYLTPTLHLSSSWPSPRLRSSLFSFYANTVY